MPKTLLLADDSVTIQKVVGISFANEDVRIVTVDNGDDAVVRAREIRPDIVLADVVMPGKSGYDVCAALKSDPALAHIPVLLLTGTFETFDEDRAARVGADGHITKPFEAQALVELVNARLSGGPAARAAMPAAAPSAAKPAAAAAAAKPAPEPEPFDFLEPEAPTASPAHASTARPVAADSEDAFAFEAESHEAIDLGSEDEGEFDLGNEATAARTTLLLDEDDAFAEAATAPPVRALGAAPARPAPPPLRPATLPPLRGGTGQPVRGGTAQPVRGGTAQPVGGGSGVESPAAPPALEDPDELTRLVVNEEPAAAGEPAGGDPLDGIEELGDPFAPSGPNAEAWDVASNELDGDPFAAEDLAERIEPIAADVRDDVTPRAFSAPLFDDDDGDAELELTDVAPSPPRAAAPAAAPLAAALPDASPAPASELSGAMREQVHTTIEKIAWEALGDVSERIVREAVARIEQVAWDVIPRLAETLIREEIRRMKGED